jgi:tetratricopeptide (TPR) repeat protein
MTSTLCRVPSACMAHLHAILAAFASVFLGCGGRGPATAPAVHPADSDADADRWAGRLLAEAERRLLAAANDPTRSGPIPRPRLPDTVRTLAVLDRQIAAAERTIAVILPTDHDYPALLLALAACHIERAFVRSTGGQAEAAVDEARALELLRRVTGEAAFSGYKRIDEALWMLAEVCERLGKIEEMEAAYVRLLTEHSGSYAPIAYLALADQHYAAREVQEAIKLYDRVVTFASSPLRAYAMYKLAWCHRVSGPPDGADAERLLRAAVEQHGGTPAEARVLRAAVRVDLERAAR